MSPAGEGDTHVLVAADSDSQQQCEITIPANNRLSGLMTPRITCLI